VNCPKDGTALIIDARYGQSCRRCDAILCADDVLEVRHPQALALLQVETDERSPAFAAGHECPGCRHMLAPWRIPSSSAHVFRCTPCGWSFVPRPSLNALLGQVQKRAMADAYQSMSEAERKELARDLAAASAPPPSLSPAHALLALLGLPVVSNIERKRTPIVTWCLAGALIAAFIAQWLSDGGVAGSSELAYRSDDPGLFSAVRAVFLHAGLFHLAGNVYFLLAFGDGVEQRLSRALMLVAFVGVGALTLVIDGLFATRPTLILGASGGVAVLIGACIVLQPQAKVVTAISAFAFRVGIIGYGVIEVGYQAMMSLFGVAGVAWIAHLAGLFAGIALGLGIRATSSAPRR
jgi:membrane associated rhomboid family serine protease